MKNDAIYGFNPESFCDKNLAIWKVFAFSDSEEEDLSLGVKVQEKNKDKNCPNAVLLLSVGPAESEKAKTFRIARFLSQKLSG